VNESVSLAVECLEGEAVRGEGPLLAEVSARIFGKSDPAYVIDRLANATDPVLHWIRDAAGAPIAVKIGYRLKPGQLYSWLGGVLPEHRRRGLAARLMRAQHQWAAANGYTEIETHTRADNNAMIIANLSHGFQIAGFEMDSGGHAVVIQRKKLDEALQIKT